MIGQPVMNNVWTWNVFVIFNRLKIGLNFENITDVNCIKIYIAWSVESLPAYKCSKLTIETLEQGVKYIQS